MREMLRSSAATSTISAGVGRRPSAGWSGSTDILNELHFCLRRRGLPARLDFLDTITCTAGRALQERSRREKRSRSRTNGRGCRRDTGSGWASLPLLERSPSRGVRHEFWADGSRAMAEEQETALMQGFPPAPGTQVELSNWRSSPFNRWAFHHVRELLPTAAIPNAAGQVRALEHAPADFSTLRIDAGRGRKLDLPQFMEAAEVDGLVILHQGRLVHEAYANGMGAHSPHILMSVSKSLLGLLAGILVDKGLLDPAAEATDHVPELRRTAFNGATIRQLLDMRTGVTFNEDYSEV